MSRPPTRSLHRISRHIKQHGAIRAATSYPRTADIAKDEDSVPDETCTYTCNDGEPPLFDECRRIAHGSAKLRAAGVDSMVTQVVDDISWYYKRHDACQLDGFDIRARFGVALRMTRQPNDADPGRTAVIETSAVSDWIRP